MKYIFLLILMTFELMAALIKVPVHSVDLENETLSVEINSIDVGVSGFVVHHIDENHSSILKRVVVKSFDREKGIALLGLSEYDGTQNRALPRGKWKVKAGDIVELAFGYSRGLLIAPSEELYHRISKSVKIEWIHPDLFATTLSFAGHPTPLREDFSEFSKNLSVGLLFIYLDKVVYTVDIRSFKILQITKTPLEQQEVKLPFYTRVKEIDAAWWGEGSDEMEVYEPHYYELLVKANPKNRELYKIVKQNERSKELLDQFELGK